MTKFPAHAITREPARQTILNSLKEMWPFVAGFSFTGYIMTKVALGVTDEDVKNSKFANPKGHSH